ncbi:MAG: hypothetical protein P8Y40_10870, partial [Desulfobacterales bacterium]
MKKIIEKNVFHHWPLLSRKRADVPPALLLEPVDAKGDFPDRPLQDLFCRAAREAAGDLAVDGL